MSRQYLLSCEHGGNYIPAAYHHLFKGEEEVLYTHKGIDFGALRLARHLEKVSSLPLYSASISRLLVEANRSLGNEELFSEYSKQLAESEQQELLQQHYYPHRKQVEAAIAEATASGREVVHLAIHSFTPVLEGEVRKADIGILFDPSRPLEQGFAEQFQVQLLRQNANRKVMFNAPYPGTDDSLPTYLRKRFTRDQYGGLELEVNQKFFLDGDAAVWETLVEEISKAFLAIIS